ncbi:hypothetical protein AV530_000776 [Patagioenas fasciata monilis]|uniref:Uncharacterized protein n=1 Tax=Patagioenas fasciata monilis TaxID=372326 RepID=A0A1V4KS69_PATFA|nr:hypothetical protein AV530_000776 [Patagioenas fasciata monilis]
MFAVYRRPASERQELKSAQRERAPCLLSRVGRSLVVRLGLVSERTPSRAQPSQTGYFSEAKSRRGVRSPERSEKALLLCPCTTRGRQRC